MSIPPNQFRRDHPWTRFVLLDSSAGPVPSKAKVTHSLTLSLKKSNTCRSTETSTDDVLLCLAGRVDKLVDWLHIHWEISLHTDLKKQIKRCIYSLAPCLCNAITLEANELTLIQGLQFVLLFTIAIIVVLTYVLTFKAHIEPT